MLKEAILDDINSIKASCAEQKYSMENLDEIYIGMDALERELKTFQHTEYGIMEMSKRQSNGKPSLKRKVHFDDEDDSDESADELDRFAKKVKLNDDEEAFNYSSTLNAPMYVVERREGLKITIKIKHKTNKSAKLA